MMTDLVKYGQYQKEWRERTRDAVLVLLGNKCIKCGFNDKRALHVDHVNGGGMNERRRETRNKNIVYLEKITAGSKEYQLLCANCNFIKTYENHEVKRIRKY